MKSIASIRPTLGSYINVRSIGAVPNDALDDTAILQSLINAVVAGKTASTVLYFPAGQYIISAPLVIPGNAAYDSAHPIRLIGDYAELRATAPMDTLMWVQSKRNYSSIEGLVLNANRMANTALRADDFGGGRAALITRLIAHDALGDGIVIQTSTGLHMDRMLSYRNGGNGIVLAGANSAVCSQCVALGNAEHGIVVSGLVRSDQQHFSGGCLITNSASDDNGGDGIHDASTAPQTTQYTYHYGLVLDHVTARNNQRYAIWSAGRHTTITDSTVSIHPTYGAIRFAAPGHGSIVRDVQLIPAATGVPAAILMADADTQQITAQRVQQGDTPIALRATPASAPMTETFAPILWTDDTPLDAARATQLRNAFLTETAPQPGPIYTVTAFGAVPNDTSDDLASFTAALTAATNDASGLPATLYIPRGTYHFSAPWTIASSTSVTKPIRIASDWATLRPLPTSTLLALVQIRTSGSIMVERVILDADHHAATALHVSDSTMGTLILRDMVAMHATAVGADLSDMHKLDLERLIAYQNGTHGLHLARIATLTSTATLAMLNAQHGVQIDTTDAMDWQLHGMWSEDNLGHGLELYGATTPQQLRVVGGWIETNGQDGLVIDAPNAQLIGHSILSSGNPACNPGLCHAVTLGTSATSAVVAGINAQNNGLNQFSSIASALPAAWLQLEGNIMAFALQPMPLLIMP